MVDVNNRGGRDDGGEPNSWAHLASTALGVLPGLVENDAKARVTLPLSERGTKRTGVGTTLSPDVTRIIEHSARPCRPEQVTLILDHLTGLLDEKTERRLIRHVRRCKPCYSFAATLRHEAAAAAYHRGRSSRNRPR